jgi:AAA15 family ATPase/GTPase
MLIRFAVENHKSVRDRAELSLVASGRSDRSTAIFDLPSSDLRVLPVAAVYGANASGKSNVLGALMYMRDAVLESHREWTPGGGIPRSPFLLQEASRRDPSVFEVDVLIEGARHQYGFALDDSRILREWLYAYPHGKRRVWFERDSTQTAEFRFGKSLAGENRTIESLTRPNSLFLSTAAQNNHEQLRPLFQWFVERLYFATTSDRDARMLFAASLLEDSSRKDIFLRFLTSADLGIVDCELTHAPVEDRVMRGMDAFFSEMGVEPDVRKLLMERRQRGVIFRHRSEETKSGVALDLKDESDGTRTLFALIPSVMDTLSVGGVICIDELAAALHTHLAIQVIRMFQSPETNRRGAQLLFNTHDTNLLGTSVLRRDEVWFTEKDQGGATHLYPLSDYSPRKDENLERGYLQGRYGAVPFIAEGFDSIFAGGEVLEEPASV